MSTKVSPSPATTPDLEEKQSGATEAPEGKEKEKKLKKHKTKKHKTKRKHKHHKSSSETEVANPAQGGDGASKQEEDAAGQVVPLSTSDTWDESKEGQRAAAPVQPTSAAPVGDGEESVADTPREPEDVQAEVERQKAAIEARLLQKQMDARKGLPPCALDPLSRQMARWDMVILGLLFYTATITPYEVGFLGEPKVRVRVPALFAVLAPCLRRLSAASAAKL